MTISDQLSFSDLTARPKLGGSGRVSARGPRSQTPPPPAELDEAERLIGDLKALVDAGLVVVREQLGGPPRYGVVRELGDAA